MTYRNGQYANSIVFELLRKAYDVLNETSDRSQSLLLIYQALDVARKTDNRVLRAHVAQCSEYVKRIRI